MEGFTKVKKVLKDREIAILSMEKKLNSANSLSRTLLSALEKSIGSKDLLCYDERRAIEKETDNLCKGIDQEIALIDAEIINSAIKPIGKIVLNSIGKPISLSMDAASVIPSNIPCVAATFANIPRITPINAIMGHSNKPAMNQAFLASFSSLQA